MSKIDYAEFVLILVVLGVIVAILLFLAWYFVRRARFKENISLIEKGIDIKDLNLMGDNKSYSPWLRLGIIITGTALGALLTSIIHIRTQLTRQAIILLFLGISVVIAYFIDSRKDKK
jgi:4-amino-4-deoxy-L-arabinose transferase-like glycosyltransferase